MRKASFGVQAATLTYRTQHTANVQNKLAAVGHKETEARSEFLILVVATRIHTQVKPRGLSTGPGEAECTPRAALVPISCVEGDVVRRQ